MEGHTALPHTHRRDGELQALPDEVGEGVDLQHEEGAACEGVVEGLDGGAVAPQDGGVSRVEGV